MSDPRKIILDDGEVIYKCRECDSETDENGQCSESSMPCYYCTDQCSQCGRGYCDQSC